MGRALVAAGYPDDAAPYLEHASAMAEHWETTYLLGVIAMRHHDLDRAIALLDRAVTLQPNAVAPLYQLSLAFGVSKNLGAARAAAQRAAQLDPHYPGLSQWLTNLTKDSSNSAPRH
jgi:Tfp pilus assembly protein PilF